MRHKTIKFTKKLIVKVMLVSFLVILGELNSIRRWIVGVDKHGKRAFEG